MRGAVIFVVVTLSLASCVARPSNEERLLDELKDLFSTRTESSEGGNGHIEQANVGDREAFGQGSQGRSVEITAGDMDNTGLGAMQLRGPGDYSKGSPNIDPSGNQPAANPLKPPGYSKHEH